MRISRISENLRVIQQEISTLAEEDCEYGCREELFGHPDLNALRKVKSSVDHLRHVLSTYIDFASGQVDDPDIDELQTMRAHRTTQILRYACDALQRQEIARNEVPSSIFEQLTQLAIAAVDRYRESEASESAMRVAAD